MADQIPSVNVGDTVAVIGPDGPMTMTVETVYDNGVLDVRGEGGNVTGAQYDAAGERPMTWHKPA